MRKFAPSKEVAVIARQAGLLTLRAVGAIGAPRAFVAECVRATAPKRNVTPPAPAVQREVAAYFAAKRRMEYLPC